MTLTGSGAMLGYLNLTRAVGSLGMVPAAGVLIDRLDKRKLMLINNCLLFTITLTLGLTLIFGSPHIYYLFILQLFGGVVSDPG